MPGRPAIERAMAKRIITEAGCWEFDGTRNQQGYGRINVGNRRDGTLRRVLVHRVSFEHFIGPAGDLGVLHRCDNPPCFNPEHLFLGTPLDNSRDMVAKGRARSGNHKDVCVNGHPLTPDNRDPTNGNRCRLCRSAQYRKTNDRLKAERHARGLRRQPRQ